MTACIWIGIFNSIQTVCRERQVIKREHRTGLHMSAYVAAHMIYQGVICCIQALLMTVIYGLFMDFPDTGLVTVSKWGQRVLCIESDMNEIPSELLDSEIEMFESIEGVEELMDLLPDKLTDDIHTAVERFLHDYTYRRIYEYKAELVYRRWGYLLAFAAAYALIAAISLEFIDRDKR